MRGTPSLSASCRGVTALVAPGPDVTRRIPGFPLQGELVNYLLIAEMYLALA